MPEPTASMSGFTSMSSTDTPCSASPIAAAAPAAPPPTTSTFLTAAIWSPWVSDPVGPHTVTSTTVRCREVLGKRDLSMSTIGASYGGVVANGDLRNLDLNLL